MTPAVKIDGLVKRFPGSRGRPEVTSVADVSLSIEGGATLGLVGESGSGKSTVARCILGLIPADAGRVEVLGRCVTAAEPKQLRVWRRDMQIVFQESYESLDPRLRVGAAIAEPLRLHTNLAKAERERRVRELLGLVELAPEMHDRFPHQISGGQQQRVNIARALATNPQFVILDEPTSSLDVSIRAGILRLLVRLQHQLGLTYLFISHDLPTIRHACDRVAVMYLGRIVEQGPASSVLQAPVHPYTRYLLGSELSLDPDVTAAALPAEPEEEFDDRPPAGCVFAPRCPHRMPRCEERQPPHFELQAGHSAACVLAESGREVVTSAVQSRQGSSNEP